MRPPLTTSASTLAHPQSKPISSLSNRVPEDVAVAGYDDYHQERPGVPPLTTYRVNTRKMGRIAVDQLISQINGDAAVAENIVVGGRVIRRRSTAAE